MQSYYIDSSTNETAFDRAVQELNDAFPADREDEIQVLEDGTICKCYHSSKGEIRLCKDPETGAVYADSPLSLAGILTYRFTVQRIQ